MDSQADRRKFKRLSTSWIVRIRSRKPDQAQEADSRQRIRDVGLGGVFIETRHPFTLGNIVEFDFAMPGTGELVQAKGIVRWINDGTRADQSVGMGIEFLQLSKLAPEARARLEGREKPGDQDKRPPE